MPLSPMCCLLTSVLPLLQRFAWHPSRRISGSSAGGPTVAGPVRLWMAVLLFVGTAALPALTLAQVDGPCETEYAQAEEAYFAGAFDRAEGLLTTCLEEVSLSEEARVRFYRLLSFVYLAQSADAQARLMVESLLDVAPTYAPDETTDRPDFVALVREVKATRRAGEADQEDRGPRLWRWVAGGVATVAAGIGAAVLLGGGNGDAGGNGGNGGLPTPPLPPGD